jgi:hypothetical protein
MLKLPHIDQQCTNQTFSFNVTAENVVPYIPNASHPYMTITIHIEVCKLICYHSYTILTKINRYVNKPGIVHILQ